MNHSNNYNEYKLLLGTHTDNSEKNFAIIGKINLPSDNDMDLSHYDEQKSGYYHPSSNIIGQIIKHQAFMFMIKKSEDMGDCPQK